MSAEKKKRGDNLVVVVAKLLRRVKRLEDEVQELKGGKLADPLALDAPPAATPAPAVALPPGVRRRPAA